MRDNIIISVRGGGKEETYILLLLLLFSFIYLFIFYDVFIVLLAKSTLEEYLICFFNKK
jgi:hypothetical protein